MKSPARSGLYEMDAMWIDLDANPVRIVAPATWVVCRIVPCLSSHLDVDWSAFETGRVGVFSEIDIYVDDPAEFTRHLAAELAELVGGRVIEGGIEVPNADALSHFGTLWDPETKADVLASGHLGHIGPLQVRLTKDTPKE